jgi:hypothetical protein
MLRTRTQQWRKFARRGAMVEKLKHKKIETSPETIFRTTNDRTMNYLPQWLGTMGHED